MNAKQFLIWTGRIVLLVLLFFILYIIGTIGISEMLPDTVSEPGLIPGTSGFLVYGVLNTLLIITLIRSSRWHDWKLALTLAFAYYGAVTFLTQIETWYFLSEVTVTAALLPGLFIMGLPIAFIFIPLAVLILDKRKAKDTLTVVSVDRTLTKQFWVKVIAIALVYIVLYWGAGYYIAWQNPNLRAFYGSPGAITPFWEHTANTLSTDPGLLPFQFLRGLLWTLCAIPILWGSRLSTGSTAVLLGLFFTVPQVLALIFENPLMPSASVRASHMIEGIASNFTFGLIIVWLLHREHTSVRDLFGIGKE
jgi:hypothetical protein